MTIDKDVLPKLAQPGSTEELSELMSRAHSLGQRVAVFGGGTGMSDHPPGATPNLLIDMTRMNAIIDHAPGDLVMVAEAGVRISSLTELAATGAQELLPDFPADRVDGGSTLGGAIATRAVGPRRIARLPLREVVLGATVVLADGTVAKSGGKVVKNVAGYDLAKLMVGSWGTLGIIVSAALRLYPKPESTGFVEIPGAQAANHVLGSQLAPAAVDIDKEPGSPATTVVMVEGRTGSVDSRVASLLAGYPGSAAIKRPEWWARRTPGPVTVRVAVSPGLVETLCHEVARLEDLIGYPVSLRGSAMGVFDLGIGQTAGADPTMAIRVVLEHLRKWGQTELSASLLRAPASVWEHVDAWGEVPGFALMRNIKDRFDPQGVLSPGRGVGGL